MVQDNLTAQLDKLESLLIQSSLMGMDMSSGIVRDFAKTNHNYNDITGGLTQSIREIEAKHEGGQVTGGVEATAGHAIFVHEGTKPHVIRAKKKGSLAFEKRGSGKEVTEYEIHHPGTKPDPFLTRSIHHNQAKFKETMADAVNKALREAVR